MRALEVLATGPLTTIQDRGRRRWAHLGVPRAGALDAPAAALANRLVGNPPDAAVLECTLGGLVVRPTVGLWVALTGADVGHPRAQWLPPGETYAVAVPRSGIRSYLALAGGVAVAPVLGSRSTDTLAGVGPPALAAGVVLPIGEPGGPPQPHDVPRIDTGDGSVRVRPGPRADWFDGDVLARLCATPWRVAPDSDRVGLRLTGPPLRRARPGELPSEGVVLGAVQVPPSGEPVVFLADHPTTGGYPVVAVVEPVDLWRCAQVRPGESVSFRPAPRSPAPVLSRR